MKDPVITSSTNRYKIVTEEKSGGVTYTPKILADFVAQQIMHAVGNLPSDRPIRILDPAVGDGALVVSLLGQIPNLHQLNIEIYGFETDKKALKLAKARIAEQFPTVSIHLELGNFLDFVLSAFGGGAGDTLFGKAGAKAYDLIIANPPYVRTQIMGASQAQLLAEQFGLSGRVDLYYAFILGMAQVLEPHGTAGIIVSNRFMSTKSGSAVRLAVLERFNVRHIWDLGDTKLFDAAVLPAVLLANGKNEHTVKEPAFTSIYETDKPAHHSATDPIKALLGSGIVGVDDGRCFEVQHGTLNNGETPNGVWRIATKVVDAWLAATKEHSWGTFRDIGKIRVGVKTCADKVFIRSDWQDMPDAERPEILKPITTHHIARRFKANTTEQPKQILYPHEVVCGQRQAIDTTKHPRTQAYLERHRTELEGRKYVIEAGREWYEIWVPQDPTAWEFPKLVFRDIAERPTFWVDPGGSVVNGDCYWLMCQKSGQTDLLWLAAAIGNSTFIEQFYDYQFNNKLYAGRRRFITQYVEKFPLPDPRSSLGKAITAKAKKVFECVPSSQAEKLEEELDAMVWKAFGGNKPT